MVVHAGVEKKAEKKNGGNYAIRGTHFQMTIEAHLFCVTHPNFFQKSVTSPGTQKFRHAFQRKIIRISDSHT